DSGAPGWSSTDHSGMVAWLTKFLNWMRTSSLGKAESKATNNHGTFKDLQDAVLELYVGQTATAKTLIQSVRTNRIAKQIKGDGSQPAELSRTRLWHYINFNAQALCRLAGAGRNVGVNLWAYKASNGATIAKAIDFMIPAATKGESAWIRTPAPRCGCVPATGAWNGRTGGATNAGRRCRLCWACRARAGTRRGWRCSRRRDSRSPTGSTTTCAPSTSRCPSRHRPTG